MRVRKQPITLRQVPEKRDRRERERQIEREQMLLHSHWHSPARRNNTVMLLIFEITSFQQSCVCRKLIDEYIHS